MSVEIQMAHHIGAPFFEMQLAGVLLAYHPTGREQGEQKTPFQAFQAPRRGFEPRT